MFYIVRVDPDPSNPESFIETALSNYGPYKTPVLAASFAKKVGRELGVKVKPRRIRQAPDWRNSAQHRQAKALEMPNGWDLAPIADHYAHPNLRNPRLISFVPNEEFGVIGKTKDAKPGAYLTQFYPELPDPEVRRYAALFDQMTDILFASTPEDIEWVYLHGPTSCMKKARSYFKTPVYPTSVYGAGDLAIAYRLTDDGKAVAERAICWPAKKVYDRIYGDGTGKLKSGLQDLKYKIGDGFNGARLLRIPFQFNGQTYFVLPYIDGDQAVYDNGEYLIIDDAKSTMDGQNQSGMVPAILHRPTPTIPAQPESASDFPDIDIAA